MSGKQEEGVSAEDVAAFMAEARAGTAEGVAKLADAVGVNAVGTTFVDQVRRRVNPWGSHAAPGRRVLVVLRSSGGAPAPLCVHSVAYCVRPVVCAGRRHRSPRHRMSCRACLVVQRQRTTTALYEAVDTGNVDTVNALLAVPGIDVNAQPVRACGIRAVDRGARTLTRRSRLRHLTDQVPSHTIGPRG